jgi:cbb3-type cytochrome oxidase subunit 3
MVDDHTETILTGIMIGATIFLILVFVVGMIYDLRRAKKTTNAWSRRLERAELGEQEQDGQVRRHDSG